MCECWLSFLPVIITLGSYFRSGEVGVGDQAAEKIHHEVCLIFVCENTEYHWIVNYKENLYIIYQLVFYGVLFSVPLNKHLVKPPFAAVTAAGFWSLPLLAVHIYRWKFLPVQLKLSLISWRAFMNSDWAIVTPEYVWILALAWCSGSLAAGRSTSAPVSTVLRTQQASFPDFPWIYLHLPFLLKRGAKNMMFARGGGVFRVMGSVSFPATQSSLGQKVQFLSPLTREPPPYLQDPTWLPANWKRVIWQFAFWMAFFLPPFHKGWFVWHRTECSVDRFTHLSYGSLQVIPESVKSWASLLHHWSVLSLLDLWI